MNLKDLRSVELVERIALEPDKACKQASKLDVDQFVDILEIFRGKKVSEEIVERLFQKLTPEKINTSPLVSKAVFLREPKLVKTLLRQGGTLKSRPVDWFLELARAKNREMADVLFAQIKIEGVENLDDLDISSKLPSYRQNCRLDRAVWEAVAAHNTVAVKQLLNLGADPFYHHIYPDGSTAECAFGAVLKAALRDRPGRDNVNLLSFMTRKVRNSASGDRRVKPVFNRNEEKTLFNDMKNIDALPLGSGRLEQWLARALERLVDINHRFLSLDFVVMLALKAESTMVLESLGSSHPWHATNPFLRLVEKKYESRCGEFESPLVDMGRSRALCHAAMAVLDGNDGSECGLISFDQVCLLALVFDRDVGSYAENPYVALLDEMCRKKHKHRDDAAADVELSIKRVFEKNEAFRAWDVQKIMKRWNTKVPSLSPEKTKITKNNVTR